MTRRERSKMLMENSPSHVQCSFLAGPLTGSKCAQNEFSAKERWPVFMFLALWQLWVLVSTTAHCKNTIWPWQRAAQIYMYKPKYLEGSLTAWWLSTTAAVGSALGLPLPHPRTFDQVYIIRHKYSPGEQTSNLIRKCLATSITVVKLLCR